MAVAHNQESMARRQPDIEDYIDMARRYRSWIVAPMFAGLVIATVIAFITPDSYVSLATMRIKAQTIPDRLIPSVVSGGMSDRLAEMKGEILSRQSLIDLILKPSLDLYKNERAKMPIDDVVELHMRPKIGISAIGSRAAGARRGGGDAAAFTISFQYTDKYKAQRVVQELVSMFTTQNVTQKRNEVNLTTSFLDDEMKQAKEKMDKLDQRIAQFKSNHPGQLPEQLQANVNRLGTLQGHIMNQNMLTSNLQQEKMLLETHLKTQKSRLLYEESRVQQTETTAGQAPQSVKNDNLINLDRTIATLRQQLQGKKQLMGPKHPDIRNIEGQLASAEQQRALALEQQVDPAPAGGSAPVVRVHTNPEAARQVQDLKGEINITTAQISAKEIRMEEIQKAIEVYQRQVAAVQKTLDDAPASDQEYVALRRDYDLAKTDYELAAKRRETADTAKNLEEHQGGEQLEQLDPPNLPERAKEPTRPLWAGIGLFGGLMVGLSLAFGKEVKDTSLKNLKDVRAYTNLPVLSSIPLLENALLIRRKRRLVWLAWSTTILVGGALMSGSVLYYLSQRGGS